MENKLTAVVITKNEEANIAECLASVAGWADEIIVVDDFSADKTVDIARRFTDKVILRKMAVEGAHRNYAYSQARNEWVLSLDADETATQELKTEISKMLKDGPVYNGYTVKLRNYIGGYWVKYGGWYPARKLRLFKKSVFKYEEAEVHPRAILPGKCGHLNADIIHKGYPDIEHFLASVNRQTTLEAIKWRNDRRKVTLAKCLWRTYDRFFRSYIGKSGFRDGFIGFVVAYFAGLYQILSYIKYIEIIRNKKS